MLYFTLASKAYARNLHYRGAHMLHNVASALFGYLYACIWIGIGQDTRLANTACTAWSATLLLIRHRCGCPVS